MKKLPLIPTLLGSALSMFSLSAFADQYGSSDNMNGGSQMQKSQQMKQQPMQERTITPNAGPRVTNGADLFVSGDFIYWTAREEGLDYASSGITTGGTTSYKGTTHHPDFGYEPGFKAGVGLNMDHDGWDLYAHYTWFHSGKRTSSVSTTGDLLPLWETTSSAFNQPVVSGGAHWRLAFNVVDLELGRNFFVSKRLALRPHFGLKGSWQHQKFNPHFTNASHTRMDQKFRENYRGLGIRGGIDTSWQFSRNWGIFGDLALSGMWSRFHETRKDFTTSTTGAQSVFIFTKESLYTITPVLELGLGLRWDAWWNDDSCHFGFQAGWEEQVWGDMNQFLGLYDRGSHGNLILQGLTVEARFDF